MDPFKAETKLSRLGPALAWGTLAVLVGTLGFFELIDHRSIADGVLGWIAHLTLFASLTICLLGLTPRSFSALIVVGGVGLLAGLLEMVEIFPTAPGNLPDWLFSVLGALAALGATLIFGRPRQDTSMAFAILLLACGLLCASKGLLQTEEGRLKAPFLGRVYLAAAAFEHGGR